MCGMCAKCWLEKLKIERKINWVGRVVYMDNRKACRVLVVKPEGKKPLVGNRRTWEDNIKLDLKEIECEGMNWTLGRRSEQDHASSSSMWLWEFLDNLRKYWPIRKDCARWGSNSQPVSQLSSWPIIQSVSQSASQSVSKSVDQSVGRLASQSASQSVSNSVKQPVGRLASQLASRPVSQSVSQSASQSASRSVSQSVNQPANQPSSQSIGQ